MTTYTWPAALRPSSFEAQLVPNVRSFTSAYGGASQALDLLGERWRFALTLPPCLPADSGAREALFVKLRGGANRVSLHHFGRPAPAGTLRGNPTLGATAAQGASALTLAGCTGTNLITRGGFDEDLGSGLATGWTGYAFGSTGAVTRDTVAIGPADRVQRVFAAALSAGGGAGVRLIDFVSVTPAQSYTFSADVATGSGGVRIDVYIEWLTGAAFIGEARSSVTPTDGNYRRLSVTAAAPAAADRANLYIFMTAGIGAGGSLFIDRAQIAAGAESVWAPTTLRAGDLLGLGGQLFMVDEDATANDAGQMTVQLANRLRVSVSSGTAVTWNKPTAEFMLADAAGVPVRHDPGVSQPLSVEFMEGW